MRARVRGGMLGPRIARPVANLLDGRLRRLPLAGSSDALFGIGVAVARLLRWVDRHTDERIDVSRAGRALLAAEPRAVARLAERLVDGTVVVSGTNGKTTTTNLLADLLESSGRSAVANRVGANMAGGVAAELLAATRVGGRMAGDIGVFEVDELWLDRLLPELRPRFVVLTNLFRDQVDRMGGPDEVATIWEGLFAESDHGATLIVSADDPRLTAIGRDRETDRVLRFGMAADGGDLHSPTDRPNCRRCGSSLVLGTTHVGHLGSWSCEACGDRRPTPQFEVIGFRARSLDGSRLTIVDRTGGGEDRSTVDLGLPGRFNALNAVAALAGAAALGLPPVEAATALGSSRSVFGRAERLVVDGHPVVLLLVKNATAADEVIPLLADASVTDLLFVLNDRDIDGRDVSWIRDADFEALPDTITRVTCGGTRGVDAARRLEVAGIPAATIEVEPVVDTALARAMAGARGELVVLANYTAMLEVRELVAERGFAARYWA